MHPFPANSLQTYDKEIKSKLHFLLKLTISVKYMVVLVSAKTSPFYNATLETKMGLGKVVHSNN